MPSNPGLEVPVAVNHENLPWRPLPCETASAPPSPAAALAILQEIIAEEEPLPPHFAHKLLLLHLGHTTGYVGMVSSLITTSFR